MPTITEGSDAGNTTRRKISRRFRPNERATSISLPSQLATPCSVLKKIGKKVAITTIISFGSSPMPNHRISIGIVASGGMCRSASKVMSK